MIATPTSLRQLTDDAAAEEESTEEILREAGDAFGQIFSVDAPRDVLAGMWSGMRCVVSGVVLAVAGLVMQPLEGMRDSGVSGCFRGVAVGLCAGLFFSVTGLCTGVFQAVRGVWATPRALCMASRGWRWDSAAGHWSEPKVYSLPEEAASVLGAGEEDEEEEGHMLGGGAGRSGARRRVADTFYYDQLGLAPSASQHEIRRAYFQQSRQWHPDKTSEPKAKERFQAISEAYQVLSDPARRRTYDTQGRQGAGEGFIDAQVFFSVLLGVDALAPYIGQLRLAEMFGQELFNSSSDNAEDQPGRPASQLQDAERADRRQVRRQVQLAVDLASRLDRRAELDAGTGFCETARTEARGLLEKDASLARFLAEIGWVYRNRAELYLARTGSRFGAYGVHALALRLRGRGREAKQQATTAKLALRSFMQLRKIVSEADEAASKAPADDAADAAAEAPRPEEEDELPSALSNALPTFMETFWSLTAHDITATLDRVVERVLSDSSINAGSQRRRAEALRDLGAAFVAEAEASRAATSAAAGVAGSAQGDEEDEQKRKRFEQAFIASMGGGREGE